MKTFVNFGIVYMIIGFILLIISMLREPVGEIDILLTFVIIFLSTGFLGFCVGYYNDQAIEERRINRNKIK